MIQTFSVNIVPMIGRVTTLPGTRIASRLRESRGLIQIKKLEFLKKEMLNSM